MHTARILVMTKQPATSLPISLPKISPCGDSALAVEFAQSVDPIVNARVRALDDSLSLKPLTGMLETMPAYGSLLVQYDPLVTSFRPTLRRDSRTRRKYGHCKTPAIRLVHSSRVRRGSRLRLGGSGPTAED